MMDNKEKREWTSRLTAVNENDSDQVKNPILFFCNHYCDHMREDFERPCVFTNNSVKINGIIKATNEQCPFRKADSGGEEELKKCLSLVGVTLLIKDTVKP